MFTYDFAVRFIFNKSIVFTSVEICSNVQDLDYSEDDIIDVAMESLEHEGLDIPEPLGIEVEVQGIHGGY